MEIVLRDKLSPSYKNKKFKFKLSRILKLIKLRENMNLTQLEFFKKMKN